MNSVEIVVVGAGPAGLAAAIAAVEAGAQVIVLDENPDIGGQIYRQPPHQFRPSGNMALAARDRHHAAGKRLIERARALPIHFVHRAIVWGIFDGRHVCYTVDNVTHELWAQRLIIATGAYDRPVAFPGWTLSGVMTAGGLQNLLKSQAVLPGERVLVVGSGPLLLVIANQLLKVGAKVAAVVEASSYWRNWRALPAMLLDPGLLIEGVGYMKTLRRAGVRYLTSHAIVRAEGAEGRIQRAITSDIDADWHPLKGTERTWDIDLLCVGYGFLSSVELVAQAGCSLAYSALLGSWYPVRDADMRTNIPGVLVVGDGASVAGAKVAQLEGTIAGALAAKDLGYSVKDPGIFARARSRLKRMYRFRRALDTAFQFKPGLLEGISSDTLVCRCEEVPWREVRKALDAGADHINQIKTCTRAGMGFCQGRLCALNLAHLVARATGRSVDEVGPFTARAPVKPISIGALINGAEIP